MSPPSALCSSRLDWTWPLQTKTSGLSGKTLQIQGHTPVLPSCAHSHRSLETCRAVSICTGLGVCLRSVTLSVASFVCTWAKNGNKGGNIWYNVGQDKEESSENVFMNQKPSGSHFYFLKAVKYTHVTLTLTLTLWRHLTKMCLHNQVKSVGSVWVSALGPSGFWPLQPLGWFVSITSPQRVPGLRSSKLNSWLW